ncbi:hypothetical protein K493DRAFT_45550 [Basidiobolus meristosporus CBS 931.73]|uniref:C2 domain-containing protein n=1 Tax=Basidiobolus meristosporus CBS 931.73 TaxID=1314790 RepID=A0A1Y1Z423_9FUNG|nr:hypothetical protein K493DRAFT_45550 [Basidiobolus meristosporus CBS 931.73]|eukprot:ORY05003.1 hypothetical protein K493DRAFT_45550 [Basidiobolus meristosporus CBS 931.73]
MPRGTLDVFAIEGKDLKNIEFFGKIDPSLVVRVDSANKQQTEAKKDTVNPAWQQRFQFDLYEGNNELFVECYDKSKLIGETVVDLNQIFQTGEVEQEYPIQTKKGEDAGSIRLGLKFTPQ